jgi:hypothetical protein
VHIALSTDYLLLETKGNLEEIRSDCQAKEERGRWSVVPELFPAWPGLKGEESVRNDEEIAMREAYLPDNEARNKAGCG